MRTRALLAAVAASVMLVTLATPADAVTPDRKCSDQWCKPTGIDWKIGG